LNEQTHHHPIPTSSDNGMTLDWSVSSLEDDSSERRWSLTRGKRKERDKMDPLGVVAEQEQQMHEGKRQSSSCNLFFIYVIQGNSREYKP
jgi:hypothetical protein